MRAVLLAGLLLASAGLAAPPSAESFTRSGQTSFLKGDFSKALRQFESAARLTSSQSTLAQLQLLRAQCYSALGDFRGVDSAFEQALQANPEAELDRTRILPALLDRLEAIRARLHGRLEVRVEPAGTVVRLDGQLLPGVTFDGELPIGRHVVQLENPAGQKLERTVVVRPGAVQTVQVTFAANATEAPVPLPPDVQVSAPAARPRRSELGFLASARANVSFGEGAGGGVGVEGAVGLGGRLWLVEFGVSGGHAVGLSARAGLQMRELLGPVGFQVLAEGVILLAPGDGGAGASAGLNVRLASFLEAFAEGRFVYLLGSAAYQRANGLLAAGLRVRLPLPL